jgi:hypothetical protein
LEVLINGIAYAPIPDRPTESVLSALALRIDSDAGENITIRDYLYALLVKVWREGEGFNGKRPWGNSGWAYDLYIPLMQEGYIAGTVDDDRTFSGLDRNEADKYVVKLVAAVFYGVQ